MPSFPCLRDLILIPVLTAVLLSRQVMDAPPHDHRGPDPYVSVPCQNLPGRDPS